jgi:hypothetical protein
VPGSSDVLPSGRRSGWLIERRCIRILPGRVSCQIGGTDRSTTVTQEYRSAHGFSRRARLEFHHNLVKRPARGGPGLACRLPLPCRGVGHRCATLKHG